MFHTPAFLTKNLGFLFFTDITVVALKFYYSW